MRKMQKCIMIILVGVNLLYSCLFSNEPKQEAIPQKKHEISVEKEPIDSFVDISLVDSTIRLDIRYATENNFMKKKLYACGTCYIRIELSDAIREAQKIALKKNISLVIFDAYRSLDVQKEMYEMIKDKRYVAHPKKGSKHNTGCALDIALCDLQGNILDFGTDFDDFSEKSHFKSSLITKKQFKNRKLLRDLMIQVGFEPYENEWWHFNFKNCNYPISNFKVPCPN